MVTNLTSRAEKLVDGEWQTIPNLHPFDWAHYRITAFLAGVRNYAAIAPLSAPRGLPPGATIPDDDVLEAEELDFDEWLARGWIGEHDFSWLSVQELLDVDYDVIVEDRRLQGGGGSCEKGEGTLMPLREFLGDAFFEDIHRLVAAGADRIVFGFDS